MPFRRALPLLPLLILMELLPAFVLLVGSSLLDATSLSYALLPFLAFEMIAGTLLGAVLHEIAWSARRRKSATVALGLVGTIVPALIGANGIVTFVVTLLLLGLAFWRGLTVASEPVTYGLVQQRFAYGFGILFIGILWVVARGIVGDSTIWHLVAAVGIGFIVVSMLALVLARVESVRERGVGTAVAFAVTLQLGGLLILSVLALQLFAVDLAGAVGHATQPVVDSIGKHLYGLLGYLSDPIDRFVSLIRPHHTSPDSLQAPPQPGGQFYGKRPKYHRPVHSPLVAIAALVLIAVVAACIAYGVWRAIPQMRRHVSLPPGYREERRSVVSLRTLWVRFVMWLRSLSGRGSRAVVSVAVLPRRLMGRPAFPDDPVRSVYIRVLRRAHSLGLHMSATTTPSEFERQLAERWPAGTADFTRVTALYVERRYGARPIDPFTAGTLRDAWARLRRIMKGPNPVSAEFGKRPPEQGEAAARTKRRPTRPFPRARESLRVSDAEREPWKPTGLVLLALSAALPVFVILGFVLILAIASGRFG